MLFRERLTVPIMWWVLAGLFALSVLLAVGAYLGPVWGIGSALVTLMVAAILRRTPFLLTFHTGGNSSAFRERSRRT